MSPKKEAHPPTCRGCSKPSTFESLKAMNLCPTCQDRIATSISAEVVRPVAEVPALPPPENIVAAGNSDQYFRTLKERWFSDIAFRTAKQGTCRRRNYGAVVVDAYGMQVSSGYTGAPRGIPHCTTCIRETLHIPSGQRYDTCRSVHAEVNALLQAGKLARGSTIYVAGFDANTGVAVGGLPCLMCSKIILNAGIESVWILQPDSAVLKYSPATIYAYREAEIMQSK